MICVCVICMGKRPPLSPMETEYKRLLEAVVSPFINTEELQACHSYWLLCTNCKLFMQTLYNFQQTALVGVKNLKCLLHKLNTQTIKDTTPRVVTIKIEPHVSTAAPKEEFITVNAPTNDNPLTEELILKIEPELPESRHEPDCDFDTTTSCDSNTHDQSIQHPASISAPSIQQVQIPKMVNPLTEELHLKFERWPPESKHEPELKVTNLQNVQHPASISAPSIRQVQIPKMDATAGEGKFEVFTHKPQPSQKPRPPNSRHKDGGREGPKKRTRKKPARVACPHCGKSVLSTSLKIHISVKHDVSAPCKCDVCGKQCRNQPALKTHKYQHTYKNAKTVDDTGPDPELFCQQCAVHFSTRNAYRTHLTTLKHVPRDQHQFECETCKKKFLDETRLQQHIDVVHLGQRKHKCDQCDKTYCNVQSVRLHIATVHEKRAKLRKHVCHLCGKTFTIRKCLNEHLLTHEGLRPHQCPLCPATFTYKAALFTHNRLKHLKIKRKSKKKKKVAEKAGGTEEEKADCSD